MKHNKLLAALAFCASPVFAGEFTLGAGINHVYDGDISLTSPAITYGYRFNDTFSIGGEIATGGDDSYEFVNIELDSYVSLKAQFGGTVGDGYMYVSAGAYDVQTSLNACQGGICVSPSLDGSGALLGIGGQIPINENWLFDFSLDRAFGDFDNTKSFAASLKYRF